MPLNNSRRKLNKSDPEYYQKLFSFDTNIEYRVIDPADYIIPYAKVLNHFIFFGNILFSRSEISNSFFKCLIPFDFEQLVYLELNLAISDDSKQLN